MEFALPAGRKIGHRSVQLGWRSASGWLSSTLLTVLLVSQQVVAATGGTVFERNPRLAGLPDNTALDLGEYECESRVPRMNCATIFDYSRINYDPYAHRMLVFGGGHAASGRTDVDVFDLISLRWKSLYGSMSCDEVMRADIDPRGFHRGTGHPAARHTYDQNIIAQVHGRPRLLMFSSEGFSGTCHPYKTPIRAVASLPLDTSLLRWEYGPERSMPWGYSGAAEFDPVSGMVILFSPKSRSSMWVYDPSKHDVVAVVPLHIPNENSSNLLFYPPTRNLYLIDSKTTQVREIALDRADWSKTTHSLLVTRGEKPGPMRNFAYDSKNRIIGGVKDGVFFAFDPSTRAWDSQTMQMRAQSSQRIGNVSHHAIDYDQVNNVFVFVTDRRSGRRTWAYRYRH